MKTFRYTAIAALCLLGSLTLLAKDRGNQKQDKSLNTADADSIVWLSYAEASKKSQAKDKHIFIHFTTKTCGWCRKMERETYHDPAVVKMLNSEFAPVKLWADSNEEVEIEGYFMSSRTVAIQEFGVRSYPQFWFVSPEKNKVGPLKGYLPAETFLKALNYVKDYKYDTTRVAPEEKNKSEDRAGK